MIGEEWRPVVGFEGFYEVSTFGRVRSLTRQVEHVTGALHTIKGQPIKEFVNFAGYHMVGMSRDGRHRKFMAHRLVMAAFVGPLPEGQQVRHLDGNPSNNRLENLAYGTVSENVRDSVRHGTHHMSRRTHCGNGHPYPPAPPRSSTGARRCLECERAYGLAHKRKKAAA